MCWTSEHLRWLVNKGEILQTMDGKDIEVLEFCCTEDDAIMSAWAKHFRNHYCSDCDIDVLRHGTKFTRAEYLNTFKFPGLSDAPGPSIRAGDFGEILIADYMQYCLGYWVPRTKYSTKAIRNESIKGSDVIGIHFFLDGKESPEDILAVFEAKTQFTAKKETPRLQDAINDSAKDQVRKGESLNATKNRFLDLGKLVEAKKVERFQNPEDKPYIEKSGAAVLISNHLYDPTTLTTANTQDHPNNQNLQLIIIRGEYFMDLANELYRRAADEA